MARYLVTGGAGFLGTTLCRRLAGDGHDVTSVDLLDGDRQRRNATGLAGVTVRRADLAETDLRLLLDGVDVVIHLAGRPGVQSSWGTGFGDHLHHNVAVAQRLLEATLDVGVSRILLASSSSVYGDLAGRAADEDSPVAPISPYGASKAALELVARAYAARGVPAVCLRYFTVYGRLQRPDMAMHRILDAGLGGPAFTVRGDGSQVRDYTHVDDAVAATVAAATAPLPPGAVLNVGGGRPVSLTDVLAIASRLLGRPVPVEVVPPAPGDPAATAADSTRARELLGWAPVVDLAAGLADQLEWQRHATAVATPAAIGAAS